MLRSEFQGDYGDLIPDGLFDREVAALIAQMGDDPAKPSPAVQAIAVFLANRYRVMSLGDLQFLYTPDYQECGGSDESFSCMTTPGFFTAVVKHNGLRVPQEFAHYDDGRATYYLGFKVNPEGKPTFGLTYANPRTRGVLREVALPLLAIGSLVFDWTGSLGYAILGTGDAIAGAALAGEIGAQVGLASTQVAQIVGSAAAGTVTSGGDPVKAIENAAASYLGAQAGNFVSTAVDSAAAAKIASAAVTAAAQGQDVGRAILTSGAPLAAGAAVGAITSQGASVGDYYDFPTDEFAFEYDKNLDIFSDYVTLADIGVNADPDQILANVDQEALNRFNIAVDAVVVSPEGDLYDVQGQTVAYTAKTYANSLIVDPATGDVYGPDNIRRLTRSEAAAAVAAGAAGCSASDRSSWGLVSGLGGVCLSPEQSIAQEVQRRMLAVAGQVVIPGAGIPGRLVDLPPPNPNGVKMPEAVGWAAAAEAITRSAANVWSIIRQVENGTYRPGATSPYGTVRPPAVGVRVQQPDGSTVVNNGNGTQTITYPDGTRKTMSTSVLGSGLSGGSFFGGVSQNTLLIAGAAVAAVLLLRK